jgi:hypothetical protein
VYLPRNEEDTLDGVGGEWLASGRVERRLHNTDKKKDGAEKQADESRLVEKRKTAMDDCRVTDIQVGLTDCDAMWGRQRPGVSCLTVSHCPEKCAAPMSFQLSS